MKSEILLCSGFVLGLILIRVPPSISSYEGIPCAYGTTTDGSKQKTADCSDRNLKEVPQYLTADIVVLDLSFNQRLSDLSKRALTKFANLVEFVCQFCSLTVSEKSNGTFQANPDFFTGAPNLEKIDLTNTSLPGSIIFLWPPQIKELILSATNLVKLDVSNLEKLAILQAGDNEKMNDFPVLHASANISLLNLSGNPMENLKADDIRPYCTLQYLGLSLPETSWLDKPDSYCICQELVEWIQLSQIRGSSLKCELPPIGKNVVCNYQINDTVLDERYNCLVKRGLANPKSSSKWVYPLFGLILLLPLALLILLIVRKLRNDSSDDDSDTDSSEEEDD